MHLVILIDFDYIKSEATLSNSLTKIENPNISKIPTASLICRTTSLAVDDESNCICRVLPSISVIDKLIGFLVLVA